MAQADPREAAVPKVVVEQRHVHPVGEGVEQGDGNRPPLAGLLARVEGFHDRAVGVHPGGKIGDRDADPRRLVRAAGDRRDAGFRLHQQVVGLHGLVGPAVAVAGNIARDEPRMPRAQGLRAEAELRRRTGREILQEHVGPRDHPVQQRCVRRVLEVEDDGLLAPVEPDEIGRKSVHRAVVVARNIAARPLDLDHPRAGIGQLGRAQRRRRRLVDGNYENVGEGVHGARSGSVAVPHPQNDLGRPRTCSAM